MVEMIPIQYREFYDIPRIFIFSYEGQTYLFDCPFDNVSDDYSDHYNIYLMPNLKTEDLNRSWNELLPKAMSKIGEILTGDVRFDESLRESIDSEMINRLNKIGR